MSPDTITALTQLIISIATLMTAAVAVIKAIEAKNTAASVATQAQTNHAETAVQIAEVKQQTDGILSAVAPAVVENSRAVDALTQQIADSTVAPPATPTEKGITP